MTPQYYDPLGGNVWIKGIDPDDQLGPVAPDSLDELIDRWALSGGGSPAPFDPPWSWNSLPFGKPNERSNKVFVDIRGADWIGPLLEETASYLGKYPRTEEVVFHIGGDIGYLEWLSSLNDFLSRIKSSFETKAVLVTRLAASWMPRYGQNPYSWRGGIRRDLMDNGRSVITPNISRAAFKHRVWLLEELGLLGNDSSYIQLHTGQPTDPTSGSDISFGTLSAGNAIQSWVARIYVRPNFPYVLGFPKRLLINPNDPRVRFGSGGNSWAPLNPMDLLSQPYSYINENCVELEKRRQLRG